MKPIKFCGRRVYTNDYVYGFPYKHFWDKWWINIVPDASDEPVYTGIIAQLVGFNCNNLEFYESIF